MDKLLEDCKKHPGFKGIDRDMCIVESKTNTGTPLYIKIQENRIDAFRSDDAHVVATHKKGDKIKMELDEKLSDYFTKASVMEIRKHDDNDFSVDFQAGFQRGLFHHQTETDLCDSLSIHDYHINTNEPWMHWIGLDCEDEVVKDFLEG